MITHASVLAALAIPEVASHFNDCAALVVGTNKRWIYSGLRVVHAEAFRRACENPAQPSKAKAIMDTLSTQESLPL